MENEMSTPDNGTKVSKKKVDNESTGSKNVYELPAGFVTTSNEVLRDIEFTEITGEVRSAIFDPNIRRNGAKVISVLLENCISRLGHLEADDIDERVVRFLLSADRDYCALMIRKESISDKLDFSTLCPHCDEKMDVMIDIDELEVKALSDKDYSIDANGERIMVFDDREIDVHAIFRFPNGYDQERIAPKARQNPIDANYLLYSLICKEYNGERKVKPALFRSLSARVLDKLDEFILERSPGPNMMPEVICDNCNMSSFMRMDISDFFFKKQAAKKTMSR